MLHVTPTMPAWINIGSFVLVVGAALAACSSADENGNNGVIPSGTAGVTVSSGTVTSLSSGGTGATNTSQLGGTGTLLVSGTTSVSDGGKSCIPAAAQVPDDHSTEGFDTKPCSGCHGSAMSGGILVDSTGSVPVSHATVTLTASNGVQRTAITTSNGMFSFPGAVIAPFEACVSKCPDIVCSKTTDHPNADDCGTCHGVTTTKIHLP